MKKEAVGDIIKESFLITAVKTDAMIGEAIKQMGEEVNRPGFYMATHGKGGSDKYTKPSTVTAFSNKSEQLRIVFQCQVQPDQLTTHRSPVNFSRAWCIIGPAARDLSFLTILNSKIASTPESLLYCVFEIKFNFGSCLISFSIFCI
jgi:hypothetical protein